MPTTKEVLEVYDPVRVIDPALPGEAYGNPHHDYLGQVEVVKSDGYKVKLICGCQRDYTRDQLQLLVNG